MLNEALGVQPLESPEAKSALESSEINSQASQATKKIDPAIEKRQIEALKGMLSRFSEFLAEGFVENIPAPSNIHLLLRGDSKEAWSIREELFNRAKATQDSELRQESFQNLLFTLEGVPAKALLEFAKRIENAGGAKDESTLLELMEGDNSNAAWEFRDRYCKKSDDKLGVQVLNSLKGIDSERATVMRSLIVNRFFSLSIEDKNENRDWIRDSLEESLSGLNEREASQILDSFDKRANKELGEIKIQQEELSPVEKNIASLQAKAEDNSASAWKERVEILGGIGEIIEKNDKIYVLAELARSIAGIDSDQATQFRAELINNGVGKGALLESIRGVNSKEAWELREKCYEELKAEGKIYGESYDLIDRLPEAAREAVYISAFQVLADKGLIGSPPTEEDLENMETNEELQKAFEEALKSSAISEIGGVQPKKDTSQLPFEEVLKLSDEERENYIKQLNLNSIERAGIFGIGASLEGLGNEQTLAFLQRLYADGVDSNALLNAASREWSEETQKVRLFLINKVGIDSLMDCGAISGGMKRID